MTGFRPPSLPEQPMFPAGIKRDAEVPMSSSPARSPETAAAQLTIFYGGSVYVYDNVPADRAQAIVLLAGESSLSGAEVVAKHHRQSRRQYAGKFQTELPIVRRNSLRHFLEKRKNRNKCLHASSSTDSPRES